MSSYKWDRKHVSYLIKLYREHPLLYQSKSPHYFNREKRDEALAEIATKLNRFRKTTVNDVRTKIKTLRSQYTAEKIFLKKKTKEGKPYIPRLWCYDSLKFLDKHIAHRRTKHSTKHGHRSENDRNVKEEEESDNEIDYSQYELDYLNQNSNSSEGPDFTFTQGLNSRFPDVTEVYDVETFSRLSKKQSGSLDPDDYYKHATMALNLAKSILMNEDRYDVLGKYIASEMRQVTDEQLYIDTKMALEGIVSDAQRRQRMLNDQNGAIVINIEKVEAVQDED